MSWRETFLAHFGPGLLCGISMGDWLRLLSENRFRISPRHWPRAMSISFHALQNSAIRRLEERRYAVRLKETVVAPPLFVLGHYRSGTTHLHNLLATDSRFAFPNTFQCVFPHTFLTTEDHASRAMAFFMPKKRPMDNMEWGMNSTQEDEFALCIDSFKSPCMGWVFPERQDAYDKYLTFDGVPEPELARWNEALVKFLKKLTLKYQRPLVLKSPPHTARIALLLKLFPGAKFVHIHRNPYTVFQSSRKTFTINFMLSLQRTRPEELDDRTLRQYRRMYDAFFEQRKLIPPRDYHEMCFEQLEADPVGEVERMYRALSFPDFAQNEAALRKYVESLTGYKKNEFPKLPDDVRKRVAEMWRPCFEEWKYPE